MFLASGRVVCWDRRFRYNVYGGLIFGVDAVGWLEAHVVVGEPAVCLCTALNVPLSPCLARSLEKVQAATERNVSVHGVYGDCCSHFRIAYRVLLVWGEELSRIFVTHLAESRSQPVYRAYVHKLSCVQAY